MKVYGCGSQEDRICNPCRAPLAWRDKSSAL